RSASGSRVLRSFPGFVQPTGVRSRQRWLPSLLLALAPVVGWMAAPGAARAPPPPGGGGAPRGLRGRGPGAPPGGAPPQKRGLGPPPPKNPAARGGQPPPP